MFVVRVNDSLLSFFAASVIVHLVLLLSWPNSSLKVAPQETIAVSLLPQAQEVKPKPALVPRQAPTRPSKTSAIIAKEDSPRFPERSVAPRETLTPKEPNEKEPAPHEPVEEKTVIAERRLPTLKELLPPITWSSSNRKDSESNARVSLNTTNPTYMTYVSKIRQAIESEWQYPEGALRYGLEGKLALEFTILGNGQLQGLKLLRSSGSLLLDEEALRAIKAASPFPPIPPWIKPNPLAISASMEYRDNRLNYRLAR